MSRLRPGDLCACLKVFFCMTHFCWLVGLERAQRDRCNSFVGKVHEEVVLRMSAWTLIFDFLAHVSDTRIDSFCEAVQWQFGFCMVRVAVFASAVLNFSCGASTAGQSSYTRTQFSKPER